MIGVYDFLKISEFTLFNYSFYTSITRVPSKYLLNIYTRNSHKIKIQNYKFSLSPSNFKLAVSNIYCIRYTIKGNKFICNKIILSPSSCASISRPKNVSE